MDKYFNRISSLSTNKELPVRIRFMLLDVIDLRDNNVRSSYVTVMICIEIVLLRYLLHCLGRGEGGWSSYDMLSWESLKLISSMRVVN